MIGISRKEWDSLNDRQRACILADCWRTIQKTALHAPFAMLVALAILGALDEDPFRVLRAIWPVLVFPPASTYVSAIVAIRYLERIAFSHDRK